MVKKIPRPRDPKIVQICIYLGYGEAGKAIKQAIHNAAKASGKPVYRYILDKLTL